MVTIRSFSYKSTIFKLSWNQCARIKCLACHCPWSSKLFESTWVFGEKQQHDFSSLFLTFSRCVEKVFKMSMPSVHSSVSWTVQMFILLSFSYHPVKGKISISSCRIGLSSSFTRYKLLPRYSVQIDFASKTYNFRYFIVFKPNILNNILPSFRIWFHLNYMNWIHEYCSVLWISLASTVPCYFINRMPECVSKKALQV